MQQRCGAIAFMVSFAGVLLLLTAGGHAAESPSLEQTPITEANLDSATFAVWMDGQEQTTGLPATGAKEAIWTQSSNSSWAGVRYGDSKRPGMRHLRIGFRQPVTIGAILVRGGGRVSVLKPGGTYPGQMANEDEWIPAHQVQQGTISTNEAGEDDYVLWVLPRPVSTRALRFSHDATASDVSYAGWLCGAYALAQPVVNLAPFAVASASSNSQDASKINNGLADRTWLTWANAVDKRTEPISERHDEWVMLTWLRPVQLRALGMLFTGFSSAEVQMYAGPAERSPRDAAEADWRSLGKFSKLSSGYPIMLWPTWLDFGKTVTTRAVRIRMTAVADEAIHPHIQGKTEGGKRVWLGEVLALRPLAGEDLKSAVETVSTATDLHPPIPVTFTLAEPGYVTLAIEDQDGVRVRNLVAATHFPAGANTVYWDGSDDLGRDTEAARHGIYHIPTQLVHPGTYRVRGLYRQDIQLRYEFSLYDGDGKPPWPTQDTTGGWLTNHTPPAAALFVPADTAPGGKPLVYLGSYVAEGGAGLAWVDLEGRKQGGQVWVGSNCVWTAAPYLARDAGRPSAANVFAYAAAAWSSDTDPKKGEIRITALTDKGDRSLVKYAFASSEDKVHPTSTWTWGAELGGLAVRDVVSIVSMPLQNQLVFVDAKANTILGTASVENPRGLAFDAQGRLLVLSGKRLVRYAAVDRPTPAMIREPRTVVGSGLDDPQGLALDATGRIYLSDRGESHQVKVFDAGGLPVRVIGKAGRPKAGRYDPEHMNNPKGITIDANGHLWVAEEDFQPKRVSVWTSEGKLWKAFYGPCEYGGGGMLDPRDKTRFYYHGMEFRLNWDSGASALAQVFYRPAEGDLGVPDGPACNGLPETALYVGDRQYMTNCYDSNPTNGTLIALLWQMRDGIAVPVAAMGDARAWSVFKGDKFKSLWPKGVDPNGEYWSNQALFVWSDLNGDGQIQPDEVRMIKARMGGVTVMPDLAFVVARVDDQTMRYAPRQTTAQGVPTYDLSAGETLVKGVLAPASSGGDQALVGTDGWCVLTLGAKPFAPESLSGAKHSRIMWSYPSLWPGLHASHEAPVPDRPGMVVGSTRLLGGWITPKGSDAGPIEAINGNHGNIFLLTQDGLFVAQLFQDMRVGKSWSMPTALRGMLLNDVCAYDENFFPTVVQTADGQPYLVDGKFQNSIVRLDGLESIRRFPVSTLEVTAADLEKARDYFVQVERLRQQQQGRGVLTVALRATPPKMDGRLDDWQGANWVEIDTRGVAAYFNSHNQPYNVTAAMAVAEDRLYVAYRTQDSQLLRNSGEMPNALFKTGGALDLMLGTDPSAAPNRDKPVAGDERLLVTQVGGRLKAMLYRPVAPGTRNPVPFSSPSRTITIDRVEDVSSAVQLVQAEGNYELSVPLKTLGLEVKPGLRLKGDVGVLRGNGFQTVQRVYWSNKATAIVADVPSEALLLPQLWGTLQFQSEP